MTTIQKKSAENLTEFSKLLKDNGFTVIVSNRGIESWLHFFKDGNFGLVSKDRLRGYSFTSVHKPCKECGTGYGITGDWSELTIKNAELSLCFAPSWAKSSDKKAIRKYTAVDEFINSSNNKWAEYYTL